MLHENILSFFCPFSFFLSFLFRKYVFQNAHDKPQSSILQCFYFIQHFTIICDNINLLACINSL
jgi:hypothetical protein